MAFYIQNSLIGLAILALIFFNMPKKEDRRADDHIFIAALVAVGVLLLLELLVDTSTSGKPIVGRTGMTLVLFIFFSLNPLPPALWALYACSTIHHGNMPSKLFLMGAGLPIMLNLLFSCASLFNNFTFFVDAGGRYHRGTDYWLMPLTCYAYLFFYVSVIIRHRKTILKNEFYALLLAALPSIIAGVLQSLFFGMNLTWIATSFSMLIIYLRIQSVQVQLDYLTGLSNRRGFDRHLKMLIHDRKKRSFGGMLIDLDGFKIINDTYGHDLGDRILESAGDILRKSIRRNDVAARIGGDEFAVLVDVDSAVELAHVVARIENNIRAFNEKSDYPCPLNFSIGSSLYRPETGESNAFFRDIDQRMYEDKRSKRH
ncbi:MAG: GGDEF domain-containing protein [Sporolactobacillus sp.]